MFTVDLLYAVVFVLVSVEHGTGHVVGQVFYFEVRFGGRIGIVSQVLFEL
jgi:hypothetical protein